MNFKLSNFFLGQMSQHLKGWHRGVLPGIVMVMCIVVARSAGSLQVLEWMAFDGLLRSRPEEATDPAVVIIGIDEADIKTVGKYPIPDRELAKVLATVQTAKPRAIGLDLFRDLTTSPGRAELSNIFQSSPNLIGIESAVARQSTLTVKPPPELPSERVGIVDAVIDLDGKLRRGLLASKVDSGEVKYGLGLRLAALYLRSEGVELKHGRRASDPIFLGTVALPRFRDSTGGYVNAKAGGNQILLNYRSAAQPFQVVSFTDVAKGRVSLEVFRDRVVLIGMTAASVNDTFMTSAVKGSILADALDETSNYNIIYGVEYQAHATSQLINAVLYNRPLLSTWSNELEVLWIFLWGLVGIALGLVFQSPWKTLLSLAISSLFLIGVCYGLMTLSWWVPLVPALSALCLAGLTTSFFDRDFRLLLEQRSLTLKRTYDAVHNGPLQTLAAILRNLDEEMPTRETLQLQLRALNQELREVYELMNQALLSSDSSTKYLLQERLYQVYENTLQRDLPGFSTIKTFIPPDFTLLKDCLLTLDQKQELCTFLQEALCNVGKHAVDATYLDVICTFDNNYYCLQIIDNGTVNLNTIDHSRSGHGTDQAKELARSLRGRFQRRSHQPHGMICELTWHRPQPWWQLLSKLLSAKPETNPDNPRSNYQSRSEF
jgi:CHASE2 domain-containing sensor protein/two-component sensor histidine kinase